MPSTVETCLKNESSLLVFFFPFREIIEKHKKHNHLQLGNVFSYIQASFCSVEFKYFSPPEERVSLQEPFSGKDFHPSICPSL